MIIELPDDLMPCLSSSATSFLNESIRVSNAESHFAPPFNTTAVFAVSVISSPNGSAVCTAVGGAGACAAGGAGVAGAGAAGGGVAGAAGAGVSGTGVAGVLAAGGVAGGDCANEAAEMPVAAIRT